MTTATATAAKGFAGEGEATPDPDDQDMPTVAQGENRGNCIRGEKVGSIDLSRRES